MKNTYCVSYKKDTGNKNFKVSKTKNGRLILKSICSVCGNKKTRFLSKNFVFRIKNSPKKNTTIR